MNKVLSVIVTFNRLACLSECIVSLAKQTNQCFDILVVNNGSTDGTKEFLESRTDIITIHQENLGGAGGFYAGMKYMYEHGYDWLWMMDDDGLPESKQLENLLKYGEKGNYVLNALVVNREDHTRLAFGNMELVTEYKDYLTDKIFHPFNGTFIHRSVIEKIGFIKKEMFIWGDEQEYRRRMMANGYTPKTVTSAIHYHPQEKGKRLNVFPLCSGLYVWDKPKHLSKIYYRNLGYIEKNYANHWYSGLKLIVFHVFAFLWRLRFGEIFKFIKYYQRGRRNIFN